MIDSTLARLLRAVRGATDFVNQFTGKLATAVATSPISVGAGTDSNSAAKRDAELAKQWQFLDQWRDSHCPGPRPLSVDEALQVRSGLRWMLRTDPLRIMAEQILAHPDQYVSTLDPALACMQGVAGDPIQWITGATRRRVAAWCLGRARLVGVQRHNALLALCARVSWAPHKRLIWKPLPGVVICSPDIGKTKRQRLGMPERSWVFGALANLGGAAAVPVLLNEVYRDRFHPRKAREQSERALVCSLYSLTPQHAESFPPISMGLLVHTLYSRSHDVSEAVLWALGVLGDSRCLKALKRARPLPTREGLLANVLTMVDFRDRKVREFQTLLRPAAAVETAERLLRPVTGNSGIDDHLLVSPYSGECTPQQTWIPHGDIRGDDEVLHHNVAEPNAQ